MWVFSRLAQNLRTRRQVADLLERDDHVLKDIGLNRADLQKGLRRW